MLRQLSWVTILVATVTGCSSESRTPDPTGPCTGSSVTTDTYVAGLTKAGASGAIGVKLVDATPAPPGPGTNTWKVALVDAKGGVLPAATITKVRPFMPDHGHGSSVTPTITPGKDGTATIDALDFVMPGVWTVTVSTTNGASTDETTFAFCIDG